MNFYSDNNSSVNATSPSVVPLPSPIVDPISQQSYSTCPILDVSISSEPLGFSSLNTHSMTTRSKSGISKKKVFSTKHLLLTTLVATHVIEPIYFSQACKYENWRIAVDKEFTSLQLELDYC